MTTAARAAALVCVAAVLAGCAAAGATAADTTRPSPTTAIPSSTTTTVAPPTTATPTTGAPAPATTPAALSDDAQLRALHDRFFEAMGRTEALDAGAVDPIATGIERQRLLDSAARLQEQHLHTEGAVRARIERITMTDANDARVRTCTRFTTSFVRQSGAVQSHDGTTPQVTLLVISRTRLGWRVADWFTGGEVACER